MFGLTKREQRWKAEQKAAEAIAGVLVAAVNAKSQKGGEMDKAEQLIACLEGEIAKRDARIAELEAKYQRDVHGLNNEGDPIGGDPAGGYANDNARLRAELAAIKAQEPCNWSDAQVLEFLGVALRNVDIVGSVRLSEIRQGFEHMRKLYAAPAAPAADASHVFYGMDGNHP